MIGRSSSPSNCRPPCIEICSLTPRSLRKNTVRQSSPSSLWRRCWHGSCRRIVHFLGHGVLRAVPLEFVDGHHAVLPKRRRLNERAPDAARIVVLLAALKRLQQLPPTFCFQTPKFQKQNLSALQKN